MTVDEILASGWYKDRRGRGWDYVETVDSWCSPEIDDEGVSWGYRYLDTAQMRLLIERDMHRDSCVGLRQCYEHPVPHVVRLLGQFDVYRSGFPDWDSGHETIGTAMDAARALAVGE